jgi:hypothetical protein
MARFATERARRLGARLDGEAAQALVDAVGSEARAISGAVEQLASDSSAPTLTVAHVRRYFAGRAEYERFSTHLAHGMRYLVSAGLLTCGLSGFALAGLRWDAANEAWVGLMAAKAAVWLAACGLFAYVSWVHWPWRSLAAPEEFAGYRRQGIALAVGMVLLSGTGFALGQACRLAYATPG